jgi:hypothetical protein
MPRALGQYLSLVGGLQPRATPLSFIHWMSATKTLSSATSVNPAAAIAATGA